MTEITSHDPLALRDHPLPAASLGRRQANALVLVGRWGLVVAATVLWLTVVPLVATAGELRKALAPSAG